MAIVTSIRDVTLAKQAAKRDGLPLPQACRSSEAVRGLLKSGEVLRLRRTWDNPEKVAMAEQRLIETEESLLVKLPISVWYGAFHLRGKVRKDGRLHYAVSCVCGEELVMNTEQLVTALIEHTGCQSECCQQKTLLRLFWGTMADSLAVQWKLLQVCYPQHIPSYWGGTMDELYPRDLEFGFIRAFQEMLKYRVDLSKPDFRWLTPLNPELPFTFDNIDLSLFPWSGIAKLNKLAPVIAGQAIPMAELCESLNVTVEQVLETLVHDGVDPEELVLALLQKGVPQ